jgi:hypothetical protein
MPDGDLMGDGVNIAALSEDAYRQVKSRLEIALNDLGDTRLKTIAERIRVYSIAVGQPAQPVPLKAPTAVVSGQHGGERQKAAVRPASGGEKAVSKRSQRIEGTAYLGVHRR